jgi:acetyltransferase-like isoleucine patch superfamily enzyme
LLNRRIKFLRRRTLRKLFASLGVAAETVEFSNRFWITGDGGHALRPGQLSIGRCTVLDGRIVIGRDGILSIGSHCSFREGTRVSAKEKVIIGSHVFGAEDVFISDNNNHPLSPRLRREMTMAEPGSPLWKLTDDVVSKPVTIEDGVWLGYHATVLKGVTIGRWSIVGAMAVVTKDVPPFSIAAGNPAKVVGTLEDDLA